MDYRLSDEQKSFASAFAAFVDKEIKPRGAEVESAGVFPKDNYKRLAEFETDVRNGLYRLNLTATSTRVEGRHVSGP